MKTLLLVLFSIWTARAEITFDAISTGSSTTTVCTCTVTVGSGSNRALIITLSFKGGPSSPTSVLVGASSATLAKQVTPINEAPRSEIWYFLNPSTGSNVTTVTFSSAPSATEMGCMALEGVAQTSTINVTGMEYPSASSSTVSVTTTTDKCWIVNSYTHKATSATNGSGQTGRWSTAAVGGSSTKEDVATGSVSMVVTPASANWIAHAVAAIKPDSVSSSAAAFRTLLGIGK